MQIFDEEIKSELKQLNISEKPNKYTISNYPFDLLTDRAFEILNYLLFSEGSFKGYNNLPDYDDCLLMSGGHDKGRDIILVKNGIEIGVIQCKKYNKNLDKATLCKEIIKFSLYSLNNQQIVSNLSNYTYIISVAKGMSNETNELLTSFKNNVLQEKNLEKLISDVIKENKGLQVEEGDYSTLKDFLNNLNVTKIISDDLSHVLKNNPNLISSFFKIDTVIDSTKFIEILNNGNFNLKNFLINYGTLAKANYSRINFFGLAGALNKPREIDLYSLYVIPKFEKKSSSSLSVDSNSRIYYLKDSVWPLTNIENNFTTKIIPLKNYEIVPFPDYGNDLYVQLFGFLQPKHIELADLLSESKNMVILGHPGAGKSLLTKFIICKLFDKDTSIFNTSAIFDKIPIRVELLKYNEMKKKEYWGIINYIVHMFESEFQLVYLSDRSCQKLLQDYPTIIFFDGFDEVYDKKDRFGLRNDIENFSKLYPNAKIIVTSRYESYEEVNFSNDFSIYEILEFNDVQIKQYINFWYMLEERQDSIRQKEISKLLKYIERIDDEIKRNPLLLSLIVILFRNECELPMSKLDLYESCTNTIVEYRDEKEKQLSYPLKISNKSSIFAYIAFWQYEQQRRNNIVGDYKQIIKKVKDFLISKGEFSDANDAEKNATEFLDFAKMRSVFIENHFSHKTFLEYFAAYYIYANFHGKGKFDEENKIIDDYIQQSSNEVVLELLLCKIDKDQVDFDILDKIIARQLQINKNYALLFFLQIIKYLRNVSPAQIKELIEMAIEFCLSEQNSESKEFIFNINNSLIALLSQKRFEIVWQQIINHKFTEIKEDLGLYNLYVYLYENSLHNDFQEKINLEKIAVTPVMFLITKLNPKDGWEGYFNQLKLFINGFKMKCVLDNYYSKYKNKVFLGWDKFNWCVYSLFSVSDYKTFVANFDKLLALGLTLNQIISTFNKEFTSYVTEKSVLIDFYNQSIRVNIKKLLKGSLLKFYGYDVSLLNKSHVPFYRSENLQGSKYPKIK